jgi:histidinol-phosphate aminotransferase
VIKARDYLQKISPYKPGRPVEEVARQLKLRGEIIKLASNENPLGTSPLALQAMRKALRDSSYYPDDNCYYLKKKLAKRHGLQADNIFLGNGSVEILPLLTLAYLGPGTSGVASQSAFIWFKIAVHISAAEIIEAPMKTHTHDLKAMLAAIRPDTRLVYIANPNNPTGTMVTRDEMEVFLRRLPDHVLVILDEAYQEYIDDPAYPYGLDYFRRGKNIVILRTFSKIYGLAGLRLGYAVAAPEVIAALSKLRISFNVNRLSQVAGLAALDDVRHVRRGKAAHDAGKAFLYEAYRKLGLFYLPTFANFIFVDFAKDSQLVFEALQQKGVITRVIKEYGFPNALRITIGTEEQNERLIRTLKKVL